MFNISDERCIENKSRFLCFQDAIERINRKEGSAKSVPVNKYMGAGNKTVQCQQQQLPRMQIKPQVEAAALRRTLQAESGVPLKVTGILFQTMISGLHKTGQVESIKQQELTCLLIISVIAVGEIAVVKRRLPSAASAVVKRRTISSGLSSAAVAFTSMMAHMVDSDSTLRGIPEALFEKLQIAHPPIIIWNLLESTAQLLSTQFPRSSLKYAQELAPPRIKTSTVRLMKNSFLPRNETGIPANSLADSLTVKMSYAKMAHTLRTLHLRLSKSQYLPGLCTKLLMGGLKETCVMGRRMIVAAEHARYYDNELTDKSSALFPSVSRQAPNKKLSKFLDLSNTHRVGCSWSADVKGLDANELRAKGITLELTPMNTVEPLHTMRPGSPTSHVVSKNTPHRSSKSWEKSDSEATLSTHHEILCVLLVQRANDVKFDHRWVIKPDTKALRRDSSVLMTPSFMHSLDELDISTYIEGHPAGLTRSQTRTDSQPVVEPAASIIGYLEPMAHLKRRLCTIAYDRSLEGAKYSKQTDCRKTGWAMRELAALNRYFSFHPTSVEDTLQLNCIISNMLHKREVLRLRHAESQW
eukprot:284817755_2